MERNEVFMSKVYAFLADGFEETEAIAVIDVLLRCSKRLLWY